MIIFVFVGLALGWYGLSEVALVAAASLAGAGVSILVLICDEMSFRSYTGAMSRLRLAILAVVEQVVYRPLTTVWRLWGLEAVPAGSDGVGCAGSPWLPYRLTPSATSRLVADGAR